MLRQLRTLSKRLPQSYCATFRGYSVKSANISTRTEAKENLDAPVQFFGSQAASWSARATRSGGADDPNALPYQPYVISISLGIFILYFLVFREENDIDIKLGGNLYDHVRGLEENQLYLAYKYNIENGLDTKDIERRLKELGIDIKQVIEENN
ncbi:uncharacterized protein LOC119679906 [Teleopsis dalmanni]|uniref:uncharacterized protein LOC119679906 n=1 Tax=Teleopsis dalmanni TaxID=139649 RepID=UPI0018CC9ACF|nr:uncharacterized protein LOC119679906 [Teleopsis dalmanni]